MEQFITFIINHWALWLALIVVVGLIAASEFQGTLRGVASVSPQETTNLMNHQEAIVVDIRDNAGFSKGHILNAVNIPAAELEKNLSKLENHKNKPIILVDSMGQHAVSSALRLKKQGFNSVSVLKGGMTAWQNAGIPLVKK